MASTQSQQFCLRYETRYSPGELGKFHHSNLWLSSQLSSKFDLIARESHPQARRFSLNIYATFTRYFDSSDATRDWLSNYGVGIPAMSERQQAELIVALIYEWADAPVIHTSLPSSSWNIEYFRLFWQFCFSRSLRKSHHMLTFAFVAVAHTKTEARLRLI